uniref:Uncharacterized protein n=1 Tax=Anopheles farauti TaxID=69004 RepID=A0A182QSV5_9DIPT
MLMERNSSVLLARWRDGWRLLSGPAIESSWGMYGKRQTLPKSTANPITANRNSAFWLHVSRRRSPVSATTMLRSFPPGARIWAVSVVPLAELPFVAVAVPCGSDDASAGSSRVPFVPGDVVCHESRFLPPSPVPCRVPEPPEPEEFVVPAYSCRDHKDGTKAETFPVTISR